MSRSVRICGKCADTPVLPFGFATGYLVTVMQILEDSFRASMAGVEHDVLYWAIRHNSVTAKPGVPRALFRGIQPAP